MLTVLPPLQQKRDLLLPSVTATCYAKVGPHIREVTECFYDIYLETQRAWL